MATISTNNKIRKKMDNRPNNDNLVAINDYMDLHNNMDKLKRINFGALFFIFILVFSMYVLAMTYIIMHEAVHVKIFARYGIDSVTKISWSVNGYTIPNPEKYENCNDFCKLDNSLADIISYCFALLIMSLFFLFILNLLKQK